MLSKESGCSIRTIQKDISILIEKGYLFVLSGDTGRNSMYFFIKEPDIYTEDDLEKINKLMDGNYN